LAYNNVIDRSGARAMMPEEISYDLIKKLINESVTLQAFRSIPVTRGQVRMPILSALPIAYFVNGDTGLKQTTEADWENKYMNIEELACFVPIPEAVLEDLDIDLWEEIEPLVRNAIARTLDQAVLFGVGAPSEVWPTAITVAAKEAGNYVTREAVPNGETGGIAGQISELNGKVEEDGFAPDYAAAIITMKNRLRNARDKFGQKLPEVDDTQIYDAPVSYPARGLWPTPEKESPELLVLEKDQFIVGMRTDIETQIMDQAVIQDGEGNIVFNLAQQDMVALRTRFRVGWQVSNQITYDNPNAETRYAAGVMVHP